MSDEKRENTPETKSLEDVVLARVSALRAIEESAVAKTKTELELITQKIKEAEAQAEEKAKRANEEVTKELIEAKKSASEYAIKLEQEKEALKKVQHERPITSKLARGVIYGVLILTILLVAYLFHGFVNQSNANYTAGITAATSMSANSQSPGAAAISLPAIMQFSRASNAFVLDLAVFLLGFLIVVLGGMFVLSGVEAAYQLRVDNDKLKTALETSSPGLVMISLGILMVLAAVYINASFTFDVKTIEQPEPVNKALQEEIKHPDYEPGKGPGTEEPSGMPDTEPIHNGYTPGAGPD